MQLTYFDPNAVNNLETAAVSVNGPFVGTLYALNKTIIPQTQQPARILVSPVDIVDPNYRVTYVSDIQPLRQYLVNPIIDLIASLQPIGDVPSVRADKTWRFPSVPYDTVAMGETATDGATIVLIPIYGRRMATITIVSLYDIQVGVSLVTLTPGQTPEPRSLNGFRVTTFSSRAITMTAVYRASDAARAGYLHNATTGLDDITYFESDQPYFAPKPPGQPQPVVVPAPRGMADYLAITINDDQFPGAQSTRLMDLFVKVSDRET